MDDPGNVKHCSKGQTQPKSKVNFPDYCFWTFYTNLPFLILSQADLSASSDADQPPGYHGYKANKQFEHEVTFVLSCVFQPHLLIIKNCRIAMWDDGEVHIHIQLGQDRWTDTSWSWQSGLNQLDFINLKRHGCVTNINVFGINTILT